MSIRDEVLKILRGSSNIIRDGETITALINRRKTTELNLYSKGLNGGHAKIIAHALKSNSTLTELSIGGNQIGAEGVKAIGEALKSNSTLSELHIDGNQIGDEGAKAIGEALKSNSTLSELWIGGNQIGAEGAKAIGEALKSNSTLTKLYIGYNQIGAEGVKAIGEALKSNSTLTKLWIDGNQIGDESAKAIGEALKSNSTLTELHISYNQIGAEGVKAIGEALKSNSTLTKLSIDGNQIGDEGAKAIGEALKSNSTLTELHIWDNQIGAEGAKAIGEALKSNSTLSELHISSNQIGDKGIQYLLEALKTNTTLLKLNLDQRDKNLSNNDNLRILFVESQLIRSSPIECDIFRFEDAVNDRNVLKHFGVESIASSIRRFFGIKSTASSTRWTFESFCNHLKSQGRLPVSSPQNQLLLPPPSQQPQQLIPKQLSPLKPEQQQQQQQQPSQQVFASSESSHDSNQVNILLSQLLPDPSQIQNLIVSASKITSISDRLDAHSRILETLVGLTQECPRLIWLYPKQKKLIDWLQDPTKAFLQDTMMMVFVCPVTLTMIRDCGLKGLGWEVSQPKKWVQKWGPALVLTFRVLQAAIIAGKVLGIPLPHVPLPNALKQTSIDTDINRLGLGQYNSDLATQTLNKFYTSVVDTGKENKCSWLANQMEMGLHENIEGLSTNTSSSSSSERAILVKEYDAAYHSVVQFIYKAINREDGGVPMQEILRGKMVRVSSEETGAVEWVSIEAKDIWKEQQKSIARLTKEKEEEVIIPKPPSASPPSLSLIDNPQYTWLKDNLVSKGIIVPHLISKAINTIQDQGITTMNDLSEYEDDQFNDTILEKWGISEKGLRLKLLGIHKECRSQTKEANHEEIILEENNDNNHDVRSVFPVALHDEVEDIKRRVGNENITDLKNEIERLKKETEQMRKVVEGMNMTSDVTVTGRQADGSLIYAQKKSNIYSSTTKGKVSSDHELMEDLTIELRYLKGMVDAHQNTLLTVGEDVHYLNIRAAEEDDKKYLKETKGKKG